ncbi:hypothetical protein H6G81_01265 [Scytonema hofmannii FACHB-248]|uniref:Uncharacterized protein n=1 Tax=Scytonema hofmannii FACHB-248 TaxID=1842502 RepID=A0ABR8GIK4_9CYAN|nr:MULTISPECIES: hypothetical protein [Nostocales]MBD2603183.1 hypothetical protein [Scytonema hofmannii FACHB-248]
MSITGAGKLFQTREPDFEAEIAKIASLVFPKTQFQLLFQTIGSSHAALVLPKAQFQLLSEKIGSDNLCITFKAKHFSENFKLRFFRKIKTLTLSGYYNEGMAHLIYIPDNNYNWLNGRGYEITSPDSIGEKFEFLANKLYPFLQEFYF